MADSPDPPQDSGASGSSDNPLGLSLGFIEGTALVSLRDHQVTEGLTVLALDLELAEVEFPVDLEGGATEFQRRSTRLRSLVVDLHVDALSRHLQAGFLATGAPIRSATISAESGVLYLEGDLVKGEHRAPFSVSLLLAPSEREARIYAGDIFVFDFAPVCALEILGYLENALRYGLSQVGDRVVESLRRCGTLSVALDPVDALFWGLMPPAGWKVPHHDDAQLKRLDVMGDGFIRLAVGEPPASDSTSRARAPKNEEVEAALLKALAREDAAKVAADAEKLLESGDTAGAFRDMRARLDASGGPEVLMDRLLVLGVSDPDLHADAADLAEDQLSRQEQSPMALLTKAAIASHENQADGAAAFYEKAGRSFRSAGARRFAGLAFLSASRFVKPISPERARLLEETIALRPNDLDALEGLIEELPPRGRASAAVRAARRLANLSNDADTKVRAHATAGDLLRDPIGDPVQAKREFERALRIAPNDTRSLEGLARAVMDQGDSRRAAGLFEKLIEQAEAGGDSEQAIRLSLALGDLWLGLDPEAAMVRYRRAHELKPTDLSALARLADAAMIADKKEAAIHAVEDSLPLLDREGSDRESSLALRILAGQLFETHSKRARVEDAIAQYEAALLIDPKSEQPLAALVRLYRDQGNDERRAAVLGAHAAVLAEAGDVDIAAECFVEKARIVREDKAALDEIRALLIDALNLHRRHRGLLDALIEVSDLGNEPAKIIDAVDRRLVLEDEPPTRAALLTRLGAAFERAGRAVEAVKAYEEAITVDAREAEAIESLTKLCRARDDRDRLASVLGKAAALAEESPERAKLLAERAQLLAASGRDADAYQAATKALDEEPENLQLAPLATTLAIKLGRYEEARDFANRRLDAAGESTAEVQLSIYVDLAQVAQALDDRKALIRALRKAHELADPASESGRQIAAHFASELSRSQMFDELALLHRQRGEVVSSSAAERAERWIEAAQVSSRIGEHEEAETAARRALEILEGSRTDPGLLMTALDVLESFVRKAENPKRVAEVLGRRAQAMSNASEKERIRFEQVEVLETAGLLAEAVEALEEAAEELSGSLRIAKKLGEVALSADQAPVAAHAFSRAANIAAAVDNKTTAIEMHGSAADAFASLGDTEHAVAHDRALLALSSPESRSPWFAKSVGRLERHARDNSDHLLLIEILSRRAAASPPGVAARLLLEKAGVEVGLLTNDKAALDSLRRAQSLAPPGGEIFEAVIEELTALLGRIGQHSEQAAVWVERAERSSDTTQRVAHYLTAARIYSEKVGDYSMALSRAQAAVRVDPQSEEARDLRLSLLREGGRREALVDALAEEASLSGDANEAAALWVEAAGILVPTERLETGQDRPDDQDVERALVFVRRAATASPKSAEPLRAAALFTRILGRGDEEFVALGQMVERELEAPEKVAAQLRRVDLLRTSLEDPVGAQAELNGALSVLESLDANHVADAFEQLPADTREAFGINDASSLAQRALRAGLSLTETNEDWPTHVRLLMQLVDLSEGIEERADLRVLAGEVFEWKLGDGDGAEREYRTALALCPDNERSRTALRSFYLAVDRFADLAENLGIETLREVYRDIVEKESPTRVIAAAEALWPRVPKDSTERAEVQLKLVDLYMGVRNDPDDVIHILEHVASDASVRFREEALDRLKAIFLEAQRFDRYCDVLRRQASDLR